MQLSDIQASPKELQDYYAQLCAQHVTPAWAGGGINAEPCSEAVPYLCAGGICGRRLCGPPSWSEPSRRNAGFCA
jgi:hypothetical protein